MKATFRPRSGTAPSGYERQDPPGRAERRRGDLVTDRLRAPDACEPLALALAVPVDRRLERVLVWRRPPVELAPRLVVAVGPPLAREPHLLHGERNAPGRRDGARLGHPQRDLRR